MKTRIDDVHPESAETFNTADFSADSLQRIDDACVRFERVWKSGDVPVLENYLDGFDATLRSALFNELLLLDIEYRARDGQTPNPSDYETRFPGETRVIESAFKSTGDDSRKLFESRNLDQVPPFSELSLTSQFHLRKFHAQGGLGVIYIARDETLGRDVAVKFCRNRVRDSVEQRRLAREAQITSCLAHPGIVSVHASGVSESGLPCYIMPLIDGQTLHRAIRDFHDEVTKKPESNPFESFGFRQLLQRLIAVCNTVAYAHEQHVIHRDIKPSNIMLGRFGETYLLDWGLAKSLASEVNESDVTSARSVDSDAKRERYEPGKTLPGQQVGTPAFASPEQVAGDVEQHDVRSDIYSLGATLYCLLVGKEPIKSSDLTSRKSASVLRDVPAPRSLNRAVPACLEAICLKAMAFESRDRYESAQYLADDLERFLAGEAIEVFAEPWKTRLRRWSRKHPRHVAGLVSALLITFIALAIGSYVLEYKNRELKKLISAVDQKNTELAQSNSQLVVAEGNTRQAKSMTLAAFRTMSDHVIGRIATNSREMSLDDREFLKQELDQYRNFTLVQGDDQDTIEMKLEGFYRIGKVQDLLGNFTEAKSNYENAIALVSPVSENPSTVLMDFTARAHGDYGFLLSRLGDTVGGDIHIKLADGYFSTLAAQFPDILLYRTWLINSCLHHAKQHQWGGEQLLAVEKLRNAVLLSEQLVAEAPQETVFRHQQATCRTNLGVALNALHEYPDAEKENRIAMELFEKLALKYPAVSRYRLDLGISQVHLGESLSALGSIEKANTQLDSAIESGMGLLTHTPDDPSVFLLLANAHRCQAQLFQASQEPNRANASFETALDFARQATNLAPAGDDAQLLFAVSFQYGSFLNSINQFQDAEQCFDECLRIGKANFERNPDRYVLDLCQSYSQQAAVYMMLGKRHEARSLLESAIELYSSLPESRQENYSVRVAWRKTAWSLAWYFLKNHEYTESINQWDLVIQLGQPGNKELKAQSIRAVCYSFIDPARTVADVDRIVKEGSLKGDELYNLACACARAAQALERQAEVESALDKAFELLIRSREEGYFDDPEKVRSLKQNGSFQWLDDSETMRSFLATIKTDDVGDSDD